MDQQIFEFQKIQCNVLIEEYKRINDEILKRIDYLDKNVNYQFILIGIVCTAITAVQSKSDPDRALNQTKYILLVAPIIFSLLGFYYSINNMYTFKIAQYIIMHIRPKLNELLGVNFTLGYDSYIQSEVFINARKSSKAVLVIVLQWTISIPIILILSYIVLRFSGQAKLILDLQLFLLLINLVLLIFSVKINFDQYKMVFKEKSVTN
jgi:hypothetical protein